MAGLSLLALMGQAGAGLVETPEQIAERRRLEAELDMNSPDVINVRAPQPNVIEPEGRPPLQGNQQAQLDAYEAISNPPEHRGAFGLRGLLREIIGRAGDVASVAQGGDATYEATRRRERLSDAMLGFTGGEEAALAAAERMAAAGDPTAGQAMAEQVRQDALRRSQIEGQRLNNQATQDDRASRRSARFIQNARRLLSNPNAFDANGVITPEAYSVASALARLEGITPEDAGISQTTSRNQADLLAATDMSIYQGENLKDKDVQLGISQQNATANMIRANRAPRPASTTEAAELARIRNRINNNQPLSRGDQETWDRYRNGTEDNGPQSRVLQQSQGTSTSTSTGGWSIRRN